MTISATARRAGPYNGNGVTTVFPFPFKTFEAGDVAVTFTTAGVDSPAIQGSDYLAVMNADQQATPGGSILMTVAPPVGTTVTILGDLSLEQPTDLPDGGRYRATMVESAMDRIVALLQQIFERLSRAITMSVGSGIANLMFPPPEANRLIGWNSGADGLANYDPGGLGGAGTMVPGGEANKLLGWNAAGTALANKDPFNTPPVGGVNLGAITLLPVSAGGPPSRRWEYANTNPAGWNALGGTLVFDAEFQFNDYWAANPGAHAGIGLRCDMATIATEPRFHGVIFGHLSGIQEGAPHEPTSQIETRATGLDPGGTLRFLLPNSWAPADQLLQDGVPYKIVITSKVAVNAQRYIGYKLFSYDAVHLAWDLMVDTGDMLDPNTWLDMSKTGLVFFSVFEDNLAPWSVPFTNVNITWSRAVPAGTDNSGQAIGGGGGGGGTTLAWFNETVVAFGGQVNVDFTTFTYVPGDNSLAVYLNGLRLISGVDYVEADSNTIVMAEALSAGDEIYATNGDAGGGGVPTTTIARPRVVVLGDSMSATMTMTDPCWPDVMAVRMDAINAPVDMYNLAVGGWTFHKANTLACFGTDTMLQRAIALRPDVVIVALGANDAILNVEGRTLAQTKTDADTLLTALRTALPDAKIVYASELMYDSANFTPATLKNKGTGIWFWQLKTAGILTGLNSDECLEDAVSAPTVTAFTNWVSLDTYIKALPAVNSNFTIPYFKAARLGLVGSDGLHLTALGQTYLACAAVKHCATAAALSGTFPKILLNALFYPYWTDPDVIFAGFLTPSGTGYVDAAWSILYEPVRRSTGEWSSLIPATWFRPSKGTGQVFPSAVPSDNFSLAGWRITNAQPNTVVQVSTGGGAFSVGGELTDAYGNANYPIIAGQFPPGVYSFRYKVGNEVFGPFPLTVTTSAEPMLLKRQSGNQATVGAGIYTPSLAAAAGGGNGVVDSAGSWNAGTFAYTIQRAGRYSICGQVACDAVPNQGYIVAWIAKNGARWADGNTLFVAAAGAAFGASNVAISAQFAVGDTIQLQVFVGQASGNITPGAGFSTYLSVSWEGF
jgi:lysophospholipase L1-like esterase